MPSCCYAFSVVPVPALIETRGFFRYCRAFQMASKCISLVLQLNPIWGAYTLHCPWRLYNVPHIRWCEVVKTTDSQDALIVLCFIQSLGKYNCNKIQLCQHLCAWTERDNTKLLNTSVKRPEHRELSDSLMVSQTAQVLCQKRCCKGPAACTYVTQSPWQPHCCDSLTWQEVSPARKAMHRWAKTYGITPGLLQLLWSKHVSPYTICC